MTALFAYIIGGLVLLTVLVADDARKRGHNPFVWGAMTVVTGLFGVAIYLLIRSDTKESESEDRRSDYSSKSWDEMDYEPTSMSAVNEEE